jgi:Raf kinase inhibitor-like YbhB/YbcL family protein
MTRRIDPGLIGLALVLPACGGGDPGVVEGRPMTIRLESSAFQEGGMIPRTYTCDGEDISPPLSWSGVPESARSLVLICEDPDAPLGTWTHWLLYNLPAEVTALPERLPPEGTIQVASGGAKHPARQGRNDFRKLGYGGPCPPSGTHRYYFRLFALDTTLNLEPGASRKQVLGAMEKHILAQGELMGRYARSR